MNEQIELIVGIEVNGTKLVLTEEQARAIYAKLKTVFDKEKEVQYIPYTPYLTYHIHTYPSTWIDSTPLITWSTVNTNEYGSAQGYNTANVTINNSTHTLK